ncbi:hypothetical protein J6W20_02905 [bacterium]|nr:hypothetical protein [bacterium]
MDNQDIDNKLKQLDEQFSQYITVRDKTIANLNAQIALLKKQVQNIPPANSSKKPTESGISLELWAYSQEQIQELQSDKAKLNLQISELKKQLENKTDNLDNTQLINELNTKITNLQNKNEKLTNDWNNLVEKHQLLIKDCEVKDQKIADLKNHSTSSSNNEKYLVEITLLQRKIKNLEQKLTNSTDLSSLNKLQEVNEKLQIDNDKLTNKNQQLTND